MKRALFISFNEISNSKTGGQQCSIRNYNMVSSLYKTDFYLVRSNNIIKAISSLFLYYPPFSIASKREIDKLIETNDYDIVFFNSSLFGQYVEHIQRKHKIQILSFFHNVELDYMTVRFGKSLFKYPHILLGWINEMKTLKYSTSICLNERDQNRISSIYKIKPEYIIPITMNDNYIAENVNSTIHIEPYILFVGALYRSNYESIKWFIKNVMPDIKDFDLLVVGKDFETKKNELELSDKIHVIGTVDSLSDYYKNAACVISPILFGSGMKVKIAEALMYGKTVFGTNEAFEGYDTRNTNVTIRCNTAHEFSTKINQYLSEKHDSFNIESRQTFVKLYSTAASDNQFINITNTLKN